MVPNNTSSGSLSIITTSTGTVSSHYAAEMVEHVRKKYSDLLFSLESGAMGGVLIVGYAN